MKKAYYEDKTQDTFVCHIEDKIIIDGNTYYLFDIAPFFPGGGGEKRDEGSADGFMLTDAIENGEKVYYSFESAQADVGDYVRCTVDISLRKKRSVMHSSQHILSAVFMDGYSMYTESVHFSENYATIDLSGGSITDEQILRAEDSANEIVRRCIPLDCRIADKEELSTLGLRKAVNENIDVPRLVNIPGVDLSLCCAVHADNTGEAGIIKIIRTERKNTVTKITFTAGEAALNDYRAKNDVVLKLNAQLSATTETLCERIIKKDEELNALKKQLSKLKAEISALEAEKLVNSPHTLITAEGGFEEMKSLGSMLVSKARKAFIGIDRNADKIVIYQNLDRPVNLIINKIKSEYDIRGGGNALSGQIMCGGNIGEVTEIIARYFDPAEFVSTENEG